MATIKILKERSLIEFNQDNQYWLHPVIRKQALEIITTQIHDWEKANIEAAKFWTESIKNIKTVQDVLTAFEAYHHYVKLRDYEKATEVLTVKREGPQGFQINLSNEFWRYGLLYKISSISEQLIEELSSFNLLAQVYLLAGYTNNLLGNINKALDYHYKCGKSANIVIQQSQTLSSLSPSRLLKGASLANLGCCYIDLFEFDKAHALFLDFKREAYQVLNRNHVVSSSFFLAYTYSLLGLYENSLNEIELFKQENTKPIGALWSDVYSYWYIAESYRHLEMHQESDHFYRQSIQISLLYNYKQVYSKSLTGLAMLDNVEEKYLDALEKHQKAVQILEEIDARCDCAEAYFQYALTYKAMKDKGNAQKYFDKALYLWSPERINAPKQIKRVKKAMDE